MDSNKPEMKSTEKSRAIAAENNNETRRISYAEEWKVLSNVLNMIFFYVTLSVVIVGTSYIFTSFQSDWQHMCQYLLSEQYAHFHPKDSTAYLFLVKCINLSCIYMYIKSKAKSQFC